MRNYEDSLLERVKNLTSKLAQKQREGSLTEELKLCIRLAQLHGQLDNLKISVQFWQSCMQIATDLEDLEEGWRAAGEIAKIYCKEGQFDLAEQFILEHLINFEDEYKDDLKLSLIKAEVITVMGDSFYCRGFTMKSFSAYERALKVLDEAFERGEVNKNVWWWDAVAFRSEILVKLGKFEESRYKEAIDVIKNVQDGTKGNVLMSLRTNSILAKIYFELREYSTALDFATDVITEYGADKTNNELSRTRRQFYCEMLLVAGMSLRFQKDFDFSLENLLLAKSEAEALAVDREIMESIEEGTRQTISAKAALNEATILQRKREPSPKDLEDLADKYNLIGDYEKEAEVIETCRSVSTNESTQKRLERRLLQLYNEKLSNWRRVIELPLSDWKYLILKGRAYEKLGGFEEAENCLLEALTLSKKSLQAQIALFFHYRSRGKSIARDYENESMSLETVTLLSQSGKLGSLIDPSFSYFATRKPSNSLMKMVGSGMVMRTKTKKTKGLELKRRRGPSKLRISTGPRVKRHTEDTEDDGDSEEGLSDFIVDDFIDCEYREKGTENNENVNNINFTKTKITKSSNPTASIAPLTTPKIQKNKFTFDSPLMIRTESLSDPIYSENASPLPVKTPIFIDFNDGVTLHKVIVRFKPKIEVIVPINDVNMTVKELMASTQTRFDNLFPRESKDLGRICGLSLFSEVSGTNSALFPADKLKSILSKDSEVLQAQFSVINNKYDNCAVDSSLLEEDFKRKLQILNLKTDSQEEVKFLKQFQERFNSIDEVLNLSSLSLDASRLAEYCGFINKFFKFSGIKRLLLNENLLCDDDLKHLSHLGSLEEINLSLNFLQRPNLKGLSQCKFLDLSYNPLDGSNFSCYEMTGMNLIGCYESGNWNWRVIGGNLRKLKRLSISLPSDGQNQRDFILNLCSGNEQLEELNLFAVDWQEPSDCLIELAYLDTLHTLDLTGNKLEKPIVVESLCKMLKRTSSLKRLILKEVRFAGRDLKELLRREGIEQNCTLQFIEEDNDES